MNNSVSEDGEALDNLTISLVAGTIERRARFDGVVDWDAFGGVVGLEILGLRSQVGDLDLPDAIGDTLPRWAYDEEMDALYVRLTGDTASIQASASGIATFDKGGRLLSIELSLSPFRP